MEARGKTFLYKALLLVFFWVALFFSCQKASAADTNIVINEIYPYEVSGALCPDKEWVELYNNKLVPVDISGWSISDNHKTTNITSLIIPATGYALISHDDAVWPCWEIDPTNLPPNVVSYSPEPPIGIILSYQSDRIILRDNDENIVDQVGWGSDPTLPKLAPAKRGHSFERVIAGHDTDSSDDFIDNSNPSPGKAYEKKIYVDNVIVSEIFPEPESGGDEFIEIYNSGDALADLSGWLIDDIEGGSSPFNLPAGTLLDPGEYRAFYKTDTHISLNDDGDSARLLDPNGDIKSDISYTKANRGQSYALFEASWQWTISPTPDAANLITLSPTRSPIATTNEAIETNIGQARSEENGQQVTVSGTVTAPPGALSGQSFYIQDSSSGIQVYSSDKDFPSLKSGDVVTVSGELSESAGDRRIKTEQAADISNIETGQLPAPKELAIEEINESVEGQYVKTRGTVTETSGDTFIISGNKSVKVIIRESTGIQKPPMRKGDQVEVCGIVSEYKQEYRLLPFRQEDVKIMAHDDKPSTSETELPLAGSDTLIYLYLTSGILILWNILAKAKAKLSKLLTK